VRYSRRSLAQSRTKLPPDGQLKIFEDNLLARVGTTACVPRADDRNYHLFAAVHESGCGSAPRRRESLPRSSKPAAMARSDSLRAACSSLMVGAHRCPVARASLPYQLHAPLTHRFRISSVERPAASFRQFPNLWGKPCDTIRMVLLDLAEVATTDVACTGIR
jgi:hypothetical protein